MTKPLERPDFLTLEWVKEQKVNKKTDQEICDEFLHVSKHVYYRWLKELGHIQGDGWKYLGGKYKINKERLIKLRRSGLTIRELAEVFEVSRSTVHRTLRLIDRGEL